MMHPGFTTYVLNNIGEERRRQDLKWGEQNHTLDRWLVILSEEVGEFARAVFEKDMRAAREEMVQVAAVAAAIIESMDRNRIR